MQGCHLQTGNRIAEGQGLSLCFYLMNGGMEMEELAKKINIRIDNICGGFHYYKDGNVLGKSRELAGEIGQFCSYFLQ